MTLELLLFTQDYKWVPMVAEMVLVIDLALVCYILGSTCWILPWELRWFKEFNIWLSDQGSISQSDKIRRKTNWSVLP